MKPTAPARLSLSTFKTVDELHERERLAAAMRHAGLDQRSPEAHSARSAGLFGLDEEELLEEAGLDALTRDDGLRDSASGCSQRLEGGQLDEERA